ncbi:GFA family protein [Oceanicella sp. SM1341]|uniref:GFA family protein n=1 Tax=Oceanicella sp. SM1341 TaxID=1548889 RepID=UPI000E4ABA47|nr:GFA family protein [Oceanicella sp. SM1341]
MTDSPPVPDTPATITGGCQCGAVRYTIGGAPLGMARCHCTACQAQSASAFGLSLFVPTEGFTLTGETAFFEAKADSGRVKHYHFCPSCGTRIYHINAGGAPSIAVKGGTLDAGHGFRPAADLFTARRLPWVAPIPGALDFPLQPPDMNAVFDAFATTRFYDSEAATYAAWSTPERVPGSLARFLGRFEAPSDLLDLGCGAGWAAAEMRARGHRVSAIDASPGLAAEAAARHGLAVRIERVETLADTAAFDGIWAHYSLQHAARAAMPDILARIARALRPGGHLLIGLQAGTEDRRDGLGRHYAYYAPEDLRSLLAAAGFTDISIDSRPGKHYDGHPSENLTIEARRNA